MPHIILTEEQTRVVVEADGTVEVRDPYNQPLASLTPLSPENLKASARFKENGGKQASNAEPMTKLSQVPVSLEEEDAVATFYDPVTFNSDEHAFEVNKAVEDYCNSASADR